MRPPSPRWQNWARTESARPPRRRPRPTPRPWCARCTPPASGRPVKMVGSGHSFTGIAVAPDAPCVPTHSPASSPSTATR